MSGDYKAIAAVIARTAENANSRTFAFFQFGNNDFRTASAGIFHQDNARHAGSIYRPGIEIANLLAGQNKIFLSVELSYHIADYTAGI